MCVRVCECVCVCVCERPHFFPFFSPSIDVKTRTLVVVLLQMLLYVHRDHEDFLPRTATSAFTQLLNSEREPIIITIITIYNFYIALFSGLYEVSALDNILRHF